VLIFEEILYRKEIHPETELAWTKWIIETENDYNTMFTIDLAKSLGDCILKNSRLINDYIAQKWVNFVRYN